MIFAVAPSSLKFRLKHSKARLGSRRVTPAGTLKIYDLFKVLRKIPKTSYCRENAPKSPNPMLVYRNYGAIVAKFKFGRLSGVGVWPADLSTLLRIGDKKPRALEHVSRL